MCRRGFEVLDNGPVGHDTMYCFFLIYICSSVRRNSRLKTSNNTHLYADIYILLNYSTCFGRPSHPSSGVHKTVVADLVQIMLSGEQPSSNVAKEGPPYLVTFEEACCPDSMICTKGCNYSFMYC